MTGDSTSTSSSTSLTDSIRALEQRLGIELVVVRALAHGRFQLPLWARVGHWVLGAAWLRVWVEREALAAFVQHQVFQTRHRRGVLLWLSERYHAVYVIPDREAAALAPPEFWSELGIYLGIDLGTSASDLEPLLVRLETFWKGRVPTMPGTPDELANRLIQY